MKLRYSINNFQKKHVKLSDLVLRDFEILDRYFDQMFLSPIELKKIMPNLFYCEGFGDDIKRENVMFHLHDNAWLIKYVDDIANTVHVPYHAQKEKDPVSDKVRQLHVPLDSIKKYVKYADSFNQRRNQFERDFVKTYLNARLDGHNMLTDCRFFVPFDPNYDESFRDGVLKSMQKIGLDSHNVEACLELNANVWRKPVMQKTFINRNHLITNEERAVLAKHNPQLFHQLKNREKSDFQNWVRLREYDYYQKHRDIVDAMGTATEYMKMDFDKHHCVEVKESLLNQLYRNTIKECCTYLNQNFKLEEIYPTKTRIC